ncbi:MAG: glycosylasparaginase [Bacteroidetes bacterium]|nr:MAG: glycosylasparaginase [Bacteroidota bacterium]
MKQHRRTFFRRSLVGLSGLVFGSVLGRELSKGSRSGAQYAKPIVLSTWRHGLAANEGAWRVLADGGSALDAVEQGVRITEADPNSNSVGYGGLPDRDGHVTLDACIMDSQGNAGSVCFLEHIKHPISVARRVMEKTPHVMLAGRGALQFALAEGFPKENLLTEEARRRWEAWKKTARYEPVINVENHDTIGMLALDANGNLAGACTTSGLAFKMHGRVGDSPIIGAGLYVDNGVGAAVATGLGELVMKTLGAFLIVELMRQGRSPQEACEEAVARIVKREKGAVENVQVGYLALAKTGETGAYALHPGFDYALYAEGENRLIDSDSYLK